MPLSEHEQRILDEIERRLVQEDPKFARGVQTTTPQAQSLRRLRRAIGGFAAGLAFLVAGLLIPEAFFVLGIVAFAVMLASAVVIASTAKVIGRNAVPTAERAKRGAWFDKMEDRWKKRFEKED